MKNRQAKLSDYKSAWAKCSMVVLLTTGMTLSFETQGAPIRGNQITPTTSLTPRPFPNIAPLSIDQIVDGIISDSPPGGFVTFSNSGTINLELDKEYDLSSFLLWNDVVIDKQGIGIFRLDFFNSSGNLITSLTSSSTNGQFVGPIGQLGPETYIFDSTVLSVKRVDLVVINSHAANIELREIEFTGTRTLTELPNDPIEPTLLPDPCCPPINKSISQAQMSPVSEPNGGVNGKYRLNFSATSSFNSQMQSYLNYVSTVNPLVTSLITAWGIYDEGPAPIGTPFPAPPSLATNIDTFLTTFNASSSPTYGNTSPTFTMVPNNWYRVQTRTYFNNEAAFFPRRCESNGFWVNWAVSSGRNEFIVALGEKPTDLSVGVVSESLGVYMPSLNYETSDGILNLWADFEYYGQNNDGELLWKLKEYGENDVELE